MARNRRRTKRRRIILLSIALFFLFVWVFLVCNVNPILKRISEEKVRALTTVAINTASENVINEIGYDYQKIIEVVKNDNGEIELIQINSLLINLIARRVASLSQVNISDLGTQGIDVPIGSLSGLTFLAGRGRNVKIKVYPVGAVEIKLTSEFVSAGINQTKHKINLLVMADVSVIMPGADRVIQTQTELSLCENIIVGKVPDTYLNLSKQVELINLLA